MSKLIAMLVVAVAAVACTKKEEAPAAAPAAPAEASAPASAPAAAPAPAAPAEAPAAAPAEAAAAPAAAAASMPKDCQDYLDKATACAAKQSGAAGDAMKAAMEQSKSAWAAMGGDPAALANACKQASEAFAAQASMMKC